MLGIKLPNIIGRGEKLTFQFSYGTKETSYGVSFFKPQPGYYERKYELFTFLFIFLHMHFVNLRSVCSTMQFHSEPVQSDWTVSMEFTEGD